MNLTLQLTLKQAVRFSLALRSVCEGKVHLSESLVRRISVSSPCFSAFAGQVLHVNPSSEAQEGTVPQAFAVRGTPCDWAAKASSLSVLFDPSSSSDSGRSDAHGRRHACILGFTLSVALHISRSAFSLSRVIRKPIRETAIREW